MEYPGLLRGVRNWYVNNKVQNSSSPQAEGDGDQDNGYDSGEEDC